MTSTKYTYPDGAAFVIDQPDPTVTYTPAPAPVETLFGNTGRTTTDAAALVATGSLYGVDPEVWRQYSGALLAPVAATDRKVVGSFKTMPGTTANFGPYWRLFYQHEIDAKVKKGATTLAQWQADMGILVDLNGSGLGVCLTAWAFDPKSGVDPSTFLVPGVTHLGVDFDGISSASTPYHDYSVALANVVAFCAKHGLTWGVPEFGANRASNDLTGDVRAQWLVHWGREFRDAGAEYVCLWEQTSQAGSCFTTPAEVATVRAMLALGPRATA